jgi:hypothetical protein
MRVSWHESIRLRTQKAHALKLSSAHGRADTICHLLRNEDTRDTMRQMGTVLWASLLDVRMRLPLGLVDHLMQDNPQLTRYYRDYIVYHGSFVCGRDGEALTPPQGDSKRTPYDMGSMLADRLFWRVEHDDAYTDRFQHYLIAASEFQVRDVAFKPTYGGMGNLRVDVGLATIYVPTVRLSPTSQRLFVSVASSASQLSETARITSFYTVLSTLVQQAPDVQLLVRAGILSHEFDNDAACAAFVQGVSVEHKAIPAAFLDDLKALHRSLNTSYMQAILYLKRNYWSNAFLLSILSNVVTVIAYFKS